MVFVVPARIIEVRFSDPGVAIDALLTFLLGVFGRSDREGQEKQSDDTYCR